MDLIPFLNRQLDTFNFRKKIIMYTLVQKSIFCLQIRFCWKLAKSLYLLSNLEIVHFQSRILEIEKTRDFRNTIFTPLSIFIQSSWLLNKNGSSLQVYYTNFLFQLSNSDIDWKKWIFHIFRIPQAQLMTYNFAWLFLVIFKHCGLLLRYIWIHNTYLFPLQVSKPSKIALSSE